MPKGPQGQKRSADAVANAVVVGPIDPGETKVDRFGFSRNRARGGEARAAKSLPEKRREIGKIAVTARWRKEGTMNTQVSRMANAMFPDQGASVVNVKFFLGDDRRVSAEQLADQLDRADAQLRSGATARTTSLDGDLTVKTI